MTLAHDGCVATGRTAAGVAPSPVAPIAVRAFPASLRPSVFGVLMFRPVPSDSEARRLR